jgi:hypothetical protein
VNTRAPQGGVLFHSSQSMQLNKPDILCFVELLDRRAFQRFNETPKRIKTVDATHPLSLYLATSCVQQRRRMSLAFRLAVRNSAMRGPKNLIFFDTPI